MINRLLPLQSVAELPGNLWRLPVRPSRLAIEAPTVHFPTVSGANLNRQQVEFPRDFGGELNLLFVPFLQQQQLVVNTWLPFAEELEASFSQVAYYELPTIHELPIFARTFINEGMRAGIPNPKARERTITLYIDLKDFWRATGITGKETVHVLLVDRQGQILWRTTGEYDEETGRDLRQTVANLLNPA
jgi:hypothetical protein